MENSSFFNFDAFGFFSSKITSLGSLPRPKEPLSITIDLRRTKYEVLTSIANENKMTILDEESGTQESEDVWVDSVAEKAHLVWSDGYVSHGFAKALKNSQKVNHFPGSWVLGRKNLLYRSILRMQREFPRDYCFLPQTWLYPLQIQSLKMLMDYPSKYNPPYYIVKPEASCQGKGIFMTKNLKKIFSKGDSCFVIQEYIKNPMLIDNLKFDIRLYVVISCLTPLTIYLYKEGLVRFATEEYKNPSRENYKNMFVHLTNYAVNKTNSKFVPAKDLENEEKAHKRSFSFLLRVLNFLKLFSNQN